MEKKDAPDVQSGSDQDMLKEINAQYAILDFAQNLINQLVQKAQAQVQQNNKEEKPNKERSRQFSLGHWVYSMKDLEKWVLETKEMLDGYPSPNAR
ncbi:MAG TPA: hypothetical protein VLE44_00220 [Candidatus Saccharimonadales bacterium]|nr:hypothetical protein [Candidatus Saccharimonadales bacterium]